MYQCVHVRKEEGRGGSREKEKGTESRHGGARVEERESKLWIETGRTERERKRVDGGGKGGRGGGKAEFAKKGDGERGWRKDGKSEVGRATRTCSKGLREREREKVEERPVSSSRQWCRVSSSRGGEVRKNGGGGK